MTPEQDALLREAETVSAIAREIHLPLVNGKPIDEIVDLLARELRATLSHAEDCGLQLLEIAELCAKRGARIAGPNERVPDVVREVLCTALADSERLDWIAELRVLGNGAIAIEVGGFVIEANKAVIERRGRLRAAIDAARAESKV